MKKVFLLLIVFLIIGLSGCLNQNPIPDQKCLNETEKTMNNFKLALEKTAIYKQSSNVDFDSPFCIEDGKFLLLTTDEKSICQRTCLADYSVCTLLRYSSSEVTGIQDKCIDIPTNTYFTDSVTGPSYCEKIQGYSPVEEFEYTEIEKGIYQFISSPSSTENTPVICVYKKI